MTVRKHKFKLGNVKIKGKANRVKTEQKRGR